MRSARVLAGVVAVALTFALAPMGIAHAEDPAPTPAPTASPSPDPTASPSPEPTPSATDASPSPSPTATTMPPRRTLPLRVGDRGPLVAKAQEKLQWLGYEFSPSSLKNATFDRKMRDIVKAFQVKYWMYPTGVITTKTWDLLTKMAGPVGALPKACTEVTSICADKTAKLLRYVVDGKVKLTTDARFGIMFTQTGEGVFRVFSKDFNHTSRLFGSWMPRAMFFNGNEAVHYSPFFHRYGYNGGSHGCIGIRSMDTATWLFDHVAVGTRVVVYH